MDGLYGNSVLDESCMFTLQQYCEQMQAVRGQMGIMRKNYFLHIAWIFGGFTFRIWKFFLIAVGWASRQASIGAQGDSFYEYLLKSYVQTNRKDVQAWKMYKEAVEAIERKYYGKPQFSSSLTNSVFSESTLSGRVIKPWRKILI